METKYLYWQWKSTIIDFSKIPDEDHFGKMSCKKKNIFLYIYLCQMRKFINCIAPIGQMNIILLCNMPKNMG